MGFRDFGGVLRLRILSKVGFYGKRIVVRSRRGMFLGKGSIVG